MTIEALKRANAITSRLTLVLSRLKSIENESNFIAIGGNPLSESILPQPELRMIRAMIRAALQTEQKRLEDEFATL